MKYKRSLNLIVAACLTGVCLFYVYQSTVFLLLGIFTSSLVVARSMRFSYKTPNNVIVVGLFLICHLVYSYSQNEITQVTKYLVLYLALYFIWVKSCQKSREIIDETIEGKNIVNIILILGVLQIVHYLVFVLSSDAYTTFNNIDPNSRKSVGIYPILLVLSGLFFKNKLHSNLLKTLVVALILIVPILILRNGSRSELFFLIFAVLMATLTKNRFGLDVKNIKYIVVVFILTSYFVIAGSELVSVDRLVTTDFSVLEIDKYLFSLDESKVFAYRNWRNYEASLIFQEILNFNTFEIIFGRGIGHSVDYPYILLSAGSTYLSSSVFHNGFLTLILQFGLGGFILSLFLIIKWVRETWLIILKKNQISVTQFMYYITHSFLMITMTTSAGYLSFIYVSTLFPMLCVFNRNKLRANRF
jgi:hypothetical protein